MFKVHLRATTFTKLLVLILIVFGAVWAQATPNTITLQGRLTTVAGKPLTGIRKWQVKFFDVSSGGTPLSTVTGEVLVAATGRFAFEITPPPLPPSGNLFYEMGIDSAASPDGSIDAGDLFSSRVKITSVTFAEWLIHQGPGSGLDADKLDGLHGNAYVTTSSFAMRMAAGKAGSANIATIATWAERADEAGSAATAHTADYADWADRAGLANNATTATYALNSDRLDGLHANAFVTTSALATLMSTGRAGWADRSTTATYAFTAGHAASADFATNAGHAINADHALSANHATTADWATTATFALNAGHVDVNGFNAYANLGLMGYLDALQGTDLLTLAQGDARYLRSSGDTTITGSLTIDKPTFHIDAVHHRVGIGTMNPSTLFQVNDTETLDQVCSGASTDFLTTGDPSNVLWQSFQAGLSGDLSKIAIVPLTAKAGVKLMIYAGEGIGGTLLTSQTVAFSGTLNFEEIALDNPVAIVAGQKYTLAFSAWNGLDVQFIKGNVYPSGVLLSISNWDLLFKTWVGKRPVVITDKGNVGIGTTTPARSLHVSSFMRLEPSTTPPPNPAEGDIYMDKTIHKLRVYDGTAWQNCW